MAEQEYPYFLSNAFFINMDFSRVPEVPNDLNINVSIEVKVAHNDDKPDRIQINFRVRSPEESPLKFIVEMVGLIGSTDPEALQDKKRIVHFLQERALYMLWATASQMIKMVTGQMGMKSVDLANPRKIELQELLEQIEG